MKIVLPDWVIDNIGTPGSFQCGCCLNQMHVQAEGEIPSLLIGFYHCHRAECKMAGQDGAFEPLVIDVGEVARLMLSDEQPTTVPKAFDSIAPDTAPPYTPGFGGVPPLMKEAPEQFDRFREPPDYFEGHHLRGI